MKEVEDLISGAEDRVAKRVLDSSTRLMTEGADTLSDEEQIQLRRNISVLLMNTKRTGVRMISNRDLTTEQINLRLAKSIIAKLASSKNIK